MIKYIIKRILIIIPMTLAVTFIVYALVSLSPVDPTYQILGSDVSKTDRANFRHSLHLDQPLVVRYAYWLSDAVQGNFGNSWYDNRPVMNDLVERWPVTIELTFLSIGVALLIGIPLGVLSAVKQYSIADRISTTLSMLLSAIPTFCMATFFVLVFSLRLHLVAASGLSQGWKGWILPSMTLGISYAAGFLRFSRSTMLDTIRQDYVRTVRSKGVAERNTIWGHEFRNALLPIITITGNALGGLLGGAVIMESVFVLPGLGSLVLTAINRNDVPTVMGTVTVLAITFMFIMLIVDLLYAVADPRIRGRYSGGSKKKEIKKQEACGVG